MKKPDVISANYVERMHLILDEAWRLLKSRFVDGRHQLAVEAPFQHHFADLISSLGQLHCTRRDDQFLVDLETRCPDVRNRTKYIDITCGFPKQEVAAAIELKFKTAQQGAQDHGRIDVYLDIESVELVCQRPGFSFGKFYMITNSQTYVNPSRRGVGTVFPLHDGAVIEAGEMRTSISKGRDGITVGLANRYELAWERIGDWFFLDLTIPTPPRSGPASGQGAPNSNVSTSNGSTA